MRIARAVLTIAQGLETPVNKRRDVMTDTSIGNQEEETFLRCDVSDETIEAAADIRSLAIPSQPAPDLLLAKVDLSLEWRRLCQTAS